MAKAYFKRRWQQQWRQFSKYLRYVFNDHAILALIFILGAGLVAYQQLWSTMPVNHLNQLLILLVVMGTSGLWRIPATFVKEQDPLYFMGNEAILRAMRQLGMVYSMAVRGVIQLLILLVVFPLLWRQWHSMPLMVFLVSGASMLLAVGLVRYEGEKACHFKGRQHLELMDWQSIAALETKRVQRILRVFSWFVDVPEQKASVTVHAWSTWLIKHWRTKNGLTTLQVTTFLRTNEYPQLFLTITILGSVLVMILSGWLLLILLMVLVYLFVVQVLPIVVTYRQRVFDHLLPVTLQQRQQAFHQLISPLLGSMLVVWGITAVVARLSIKMVIITEFTLVLWVIALVFLYSDRKAENMFKRR